MDSTFLIVTVIIIAAIPLQLGLLYIVYKQSVMYIIAKTITPATVVAIFCGFVVGYMGLVHLWWTVPVVIISYMLTFYFIGRMLGKPMKLFSTILAKLAEGDFKAEKNKIKFQNNEIGYISKSIDVMIDKITGILQEIKNSSDILTNVSSELSTGAQRMSSISSEQAASFEEMTASVEQILEHVKVNTSNAVDAEQVVESSANEIKQNNDSVQKTIDALKNIAAKITIINDIASKTNILSLNAAIEAARAGEYGKGFGVVAGEVGKLAEQSKHSADEIIDISNESSKLAEKTGKSSKEILPKVENAVSLMRHISIGSKEQESGVVQINSSLNELNNSVQRLAGASEEIASNAEELASQSVKLKDKVSYFKI